MKKITEQWLKHADDDLRSARILAEKQIYGMSCFHAQQCAEKALKAILQENSINPPRIHNIKTLKDIVEQQVSSRVDITIEEANFLAVIYIESRYPSDIGLLPSGEPSSEDAQEAVRIATKVFEHIKKQLL